MADVTPFRGVRYSELKDNTKVVSPPYDVITPAYQEELYNTDEHNIVRIDFGMDLPGDNESNNKYTRSGATLDEWMKKEILKQDEKPAYYVYYIDYIHPYSQKPKVLKGFFALVKAVPFSEGSVLPHEHTFPKHKLDRLKLIRECKGNLSAVFSIYSDKTDSVMSSINPVDTAPLIDFQDSEGKRHRIWGVSEGIDNVAKLLESKTIYIADGHHRYSTSVDYKNEVRSADPNDASADYIMMFLANMEDPGLTILPTHRVLTSIESKSELIERLKGKFNVTEWDAGRSVAEFQKHLREQTGHVFGLVLSGADKFYQLQLKKSDKGMLDVEIFRKFIVEWVYSKEQIYSADNITYVKDQHEVIDIVEKGGESYAGFLLNATKLEDMVRIVEADEKMPHKSTYFYPKPLTGLLVNKFN